ncbi:Protein FIP1 [Camellia lanceoleosa]|uniref:Protein FIP1 n=1 Tax=Camellia lanceoleosa TaxID=1840588 RepID=A0ACC0HLK2_9ERIC|nr:Protein FIP1 [Camellia lanceoleosa]
MGLGIGLHQYNSLDSHPDDMLSLYSPLLPSSSLEGLRNGVGHYKLGIRFGNARVSYLTGEPTMLKFTEDADQGFSHLRRGNLA